MEVRVTGAMLASILSEMATGMDVEGLLYGTVLQRNTQTIDDSDVASSSKETSQYVIKSYVKCAIGGVPNVFYDGTGIVDKTAISNMHQQVTYSHQGSGLFLLGWFKGRRNTPLKPSCRELAVTRSLGSHIQHPLFALFTLSHPNNIKSFDYRFFLGGPVGTAEPFVTNLVSSSQVEYHEFDVLWATGEFFGLMNNTPPGNPHSGDPNSSTTSILETTHANSLAKLHKLSQQIAATYKECFEVERGIALLQEQLAGNQKMR